MTTEQDTPIDALFKYFKDKYPYVLDYRAEYQNWKIAIHNTSNFDRKFIVIYIDAKVKFCDNDYYTKDEGFCVFTHNLCEPNIIDLIDEYLK